MKSVIEKITLNEATFNNEVIEPTFVNFFYGKNGAGKSTIARTIRSNIGLDWRAGMSASGYDVLVYDTDFVDDNFANYDNLAGVFTVCKTNIEVQKQLEELEEQKKQKGNEYYAAKAEVEKKTAERTVALDTYYAECWDKTEQLRQVFDPAIKGKKKRVLFAEEILAKLPKEHDLSVLETTISMVFNGDDTKYELLKKPETFSCMNVPGYELLSKIIVSSSETPFSSFIKALGATDWVRQGHIHYESDANGMCPYCQQKLPENFEQKIAECYDNQYQNDINHLISFQSAFTAYADSVIGIYKNNLELPNPDLDMAVYIDKLNLLQKAIVINKGRIETKLKEPATVVSFEDIDSLICELNSVVDKINAAIDVRNYIIGDRKNQEEQCKREVWEHLAFVLKDSVKKYRDTVTQLDNDVNHLKMQMQTLVDEGNKLKEEMKDLNKQVVNTEGAIEGINRIIKTSGFQGFSLKAKDGVPNTYEVIRPDGSIAVRLSEGERNFIAFLYFYHLVKGSLNGDEMKEKVVVIDDPVSSMDSGALFIVSALVREMIEICNNNAEYLNQKVEGDFIKQIFILTHNVYFHKEVTHKQTKRYNSVSFYMIRKTDNISSITHCIRQSQSRPTDLENYNPIQNSYAALWDEYKELKTVNTITNVIRHILEYYFVQLCGYEGNDLQKIVLEDNKEKFIEREEGKKPNYDKYHLASALLSYINDSPAIVSDGLNFVEDGTDVERYRVVFRLIFESMQQEQHYKMMMNIEE